MKKRSICIYEKYLFTKRIFCCIIARRCGGIAQMVERMVRIHEVRGSIPLISTKTILHKTHFLLWRLRSNSMVCVNNEKAEGF